MRHLEYNLLRHYRQQCRFTIKQLSRKSKVSMRTIWSIEHSYACRQDIKAKLLKALDMEFKERHKVWPPEVAA